MYSIIISTIYLIHAISVNHPTMALFSLLILLLAIGRQHQYNRNRRYHRHS